jgi:hypothetical protein
MPRGGFGRGFGRRRFGAPFVIPMGGYGMGGSPLLTSLLAGGVGYALGSGAAQQNQQQPAVYQPYPYPYPYQAPPQAAPAPSQGSENGQLAQLQLLGRLHESGVLTDDEFEREKQRILRGSSDSLNP